MRGNAAHFGGWWVGCGFPGQARRAAHWKQRAGPDCRGAAMPGRRHDQASPYESLRQALTADSGRASQAAARAA